MKRGRTISDWMSSALSKNSTCTTGKRKGSSTSTGAIPESVANDASPWVEFYRPCTATDLAVHKKKIEELQQWLQFSLSPAARHPLLLITGPVGCGKTATLHALANDLGFFVLEWVNPVTGPPLDEDYGPGGSSSHYYQSQGKQFQQFLLQANRYPSLVVGSGPEEQRDKKIVLVEEFPNAFLREPYKFHDIMRSVHRSLLHPLVFIVSEAQMESSSAVALFPKDFVLSLDIHCISFNPVAHTNMLKTLQRIVAAECDTSSSKRSHPAGVTFCAPSNEALESLVERCAGDIRAGVNALQFICLQGGSGPVTTSSASSRHHQCGPHLKAASRKAASRGATGAGTKKGGPDEACASIGGRDSSLYLFRALGKILHCKRDSASCPDTLPTHLARHNRPSLLVNPEEVVEQTQISSEMFILYLHQNYLDFFDDIDGLVSCAEYFCDADVLERVKVSNESQAVHQSYATSVASRGVMHSQRLTTAGRWRPLHKPQWLNTKKQYNENSAAARRLFLHLGTSDHVRLWTPIELQVEILPYLALINIPLQNASQAALLQSISQFSTQHYCSFRSRPESLEEKDIGIYLEESLPSPPSLVDHTVPGSTQTSSQNISPLGQDSDCNIEDYDDDDDDDGGGGGGDNGDMDEDEKFWQELMV